MKKLHQIYWFTLIVIIFCISTILCLLQLGQGGRKKSREDMQEKKARNLLTMSDCPHGFKHDNNGICRHKFNIYRKRKNASVGPKIQTFEQKPTKTQMDFWVSTLKNMA